MGLFAGEAELLNDDRVGRALDELFLADRASLTTALSLAAISAYGVSLDELHNDSTSICLYGAHRGATGGARGGVTPSRPTWGHSLQAGDLLVVEPGELHTFVDSSDDYLHFVVQAPFVNGDKRIAWPAIGDSTVRIPI